MDSNLIKLCRLCMGQDSLESIHNLDTDNISYDVKIVNCVNIKVLEDDDLSSLVCKSCVDLIKKFYEFKINCSLVSLKLEKIRIEKVEESKSCEEFIDVNNFISSESKHSLENWLSDDNKSDVSMNYLENEDDVSINNLNKSSLNILENKSKKPHQCEHCGQILKNKAILIKHLLVHTGLKLFSCKICFKKFSRDEHRLVHMRKHSGIKAYVCEVCGKTSFRRQDLIRHMKVHSDEKKYECSMCNKRFKHSFDVSIHMRTHTGARPFNCANCNKTYTSHSGLRKHKLTQCRKLEL